MSKNSNNSKTVERCPKCNRKRTPSMYAVDDEWLCEECWEKSVVAVGYPQLLQK
jgi:hypothetical protein